MTLPSPKFTVEEIGAKGVAEAAGVDLLALVFLLEGSSVGGLVVGRRILLLQPPRQWSCPHEPTSIMANAQQKIKIELGGHDYHTVFILV